MAKKSESTAEFHVLPAPKVVIDHHGKTLLGSMKQWQESSRVPPVLLMTGLSGVGKRTLGYFLAQWIFCEKTGMNQSDNPGEVSLFGAPVAQTSKQLLPCNECSACQKAIRNNWVDFQEVLPEGEDEEKSESLKIDQFRQIKASAGFGAHEGKYRIFLIPNADRMTVQAANSLLKILEEPPRGWIFILSASDTTLLPATLISRCQVMKLKPFAAAEIESLLGSVPPERRKLAAGLAMGSWGKALKLTSDEVWEARSGIFKLLNMPDRVIGELIDWATAKPVHFDLLIDQLETILIDLVNWSVSRETHHWLNIDGEKALLVYAQDFSKRMGSIEKARSEWILRAERLATARREALAPLNRKILVQDILLKWL